MVERTSSQHWESRIAELVQPEKINADRRIAIADGRDIKAKTFRILPDGPC